MAAKTLILVMEEGSGRILAARIAPLSRAEYECQKLVDYFQLGAAEETIPLSAISQTFTIRLNRATRGPKIQTDQDITLPVFPSSQPLL
jgi:hypothetical protein